MDFPDREFCVADFPSVSAAVAIGSELSGGIRNVRVHDCRISGVGIGIRIKTMPGRGGFVENVRFEKLEMDEIAGAALHFTTDYGQSTVRAQGDAATTIRDVLCRNILCRKAKYGIYTQGVENQRVSCVVAEQCRLAAGTPRLDEGFPFSLREK